MGTNILFKGLVDGRKNNLIAMKTSFFLKKNYTNRDGKSPLYLNLYIHKERKRIPVDIFIEPNFWDQKKQLVISGDNKNDLNLLIKDIRSQINKIEIQYRLSGGVLTADKCVELLRKPDLSIDFIQFFEYELENKSIEKNTKKNHSAIIKKIKAYKKQILFLEINEDWILKYRKYLERIGNSSVTIDNNIKVIKQYLKIAEKKGIPLAIDREEIKIKHHRSNRINLSISEIESMKKYYQSEFIRPAHRQTLGYFLFNCMTGLRITDLLNLRRNMLSEEYFSFWNQKGKKQQTLFINNTARMVIDSDETLFLEPITQKTINETIKDIAKFLGIKKHITCHVARHTFATNYLRKGGKVEDLQHLLGHSDIKTTMIYVHIVESEAVKSMSLLD